MVGSELTDREKQILQYVIHQYILTATPVGSRNISKKYDVGLSPASIRNIMSDLEDFGFLNHPHTSAGRIPTDKGYRFYVDNLIEPKHLNHLEKQKIDAGFEVERVEHDNFLSIAGSLLSSITHQIACVTFPKFEDSVLEKIQIVRLSSTRILVVLSIKSGLVKTITLEIDAKTEQSNIQTIEHVLNSRLADLKFSEIRETFKDRIKDKLSNELKPILRVFLDSADKIFTEIKTNDKSIITGIKNLIEQPEFVDSDSFQSIIELIEDKNIIVHIMDENKKGSSGEDILIKIGNESKEEKLSNYSLVIKEYNVDNAIGTLGIIGPKRMQYSKMLAVVAYVAEKLSKELKIQNL